jgi:hypothetical protein
MFFGSIPPSNDTEQPKAPSADEFADAAYAFAQKRAAAGLSPEQIHSEMIEAGFGADLAEAVVAELRANGAKGTVCGSRLRRARPVLAERARQAPRPVRDGRKRMIYGAVWFFGGTAVTVMTLASAKSGGGYVIAWGAIVYGAIEFFRGMADA